MKAVAVFPGKPNSIHLADMPELEVDDILDGRGVFVEVLRVGVDGTDKEINDAEYGDAPEGYNYLVIGHESFGRVLEVGPNVRGLEPGDYVVATVRNLAYVCTGRSSDSLRSAARSRPRTYIASALRGP